MPTVVRYNIDGMTVAVESSVDELLPTLNNLFPLSAGEADPPSRWAFSIVVEQGSFLLTGGGQPYRTTDISTVVPILEGRIRGQYLDRAGSEWAFHSSGFLNKDGEAVLALGESGAGKTTLALRAVAAGACGLSDELHLWSPATGLVVGLPRAYTVRKGTVEAFPHLRPIIARLDAHQWGGQPLWYVNPNAFSLFHPAKPAKLNSFVLLSRTMQGRSLRLLPQWQRLAALAPHARMPGGSLQEKQVIEHMQMLSRIPVYEGAPDAVLDHFGESRAGKNTRRSSAFSDSVRA
jgi:hypothetical protein